MSASVVTEATVDRIETQEVYLSISKDNVLKYCNLYIYDHII